MSTSAVISRSSHSNSTLSHSISTLQSEFNHPFHQLRQYGLGHISTDRRSLRSSLTKVHSSAAQVREIIFFSAEAPVIEGDIHNMMGRNKFKEIADSPQITLHSIHYCVKGLNWLQQSMKAPELLTQSVSKEEPSNAEKRARAILNHVYLVVEMKGAMPGGETVSWYIRAEKQGAPADSRR